jgi:hypothetical protein
MPQLPPSSTNSNGRVRPPMLDSVLAKLNKVRQTSGGWQACCPVHGDEHPSLSIGIGREGRILLHCHAHACSFDDIVSALGMKAADFAPGSPARPTPLGAKAKTGPTKCLKSLSALNGANADGSEELKSLSASEQDEVLRGVGLREMRQMGQPTSRPTPFPTNVFPEPLKRLVEETSATMPCPPDYIGMGVIVVTASFIGPQRPIRIKRGWDERAVIYGAIVGPTGSRKSPALEAAMTPARKHDRQLATEHEAVMRDYRERLRAAKKPLDEDPPVPRQHVTTDTTVEALADVLAWNPRGVLVYRDELSGWVASLNQYKGGKGSDRQFWLSAWSCQDFTINRKGKPPLRIVRPFPPVIGNIPPDMLGELADRRGREDGFIDRILFAYPEPILVKWTDKTVNPKLEGAYAEACLKIGRLPNATLALTPPAQAEFAAWYDEHNRSHNGPAGPWAKMDGYCARLANILHHLRWAFAGKEELKRLSADKVDVESVRGAIELIDYFKNHVRRAIGDMRAGKEGKLLGRLLAFVVNAPDRKVRPRALISAQIAANADSAKELLQKLAEIGLGTMIGGRRKDEVIFQGRDDLEEITGRFEEVQST